jgi:hypothetical protein
LATQAPKTLSPVGARRPARIVAVAVVFNALTHARPYKPAWPVRDAAAGVAPGGAAEASRLGAAPVRVTQQAQSVLGESHRRTIPSVKGVPHLIERVQTRVAVLPTSHENVTSNEP